MKTLPEPQVQLPGTFLEPRGVHGSICWLFAESIVVNDHSAAIHIQDARMGGGTDIIVPKDDRRGTFSRFFFYFETERECEPTVGGAGAERGSERIPGGLRARTHEPGDVTRAEIKSQTLNPLSQPGAFRDAL